MRIAGITSFLASQYGSQGATKARPTRGRAYSTGAGRPGPASTAAVVTAVRTAVVLAVDVVVVADIVGVLGVQVVLLGGLVVWRRCRGGMPVGRVYAVPLQLTLELSQVGVHASIHQVSADPR